MDEQSFNELLDSVTGMCRHMRGKETSGRATIIEDPDVKAIRETTRLSQSRFALMIGVKVKTLQNWEQKRVRPTGPARALMQIVAADPQVAIRALQGHVA
ncbi:helix-turn-helix domain-containing protein [Acidithiobacillus ferrivorans]|uniref:Transcriptional regulator n=1 Tax=Acidithiobacillus ferrivorans TaxID=160808 RepID=A0A7T5BGW1_9PROT|nr:transcriptional regulator [Acidithiobacillus ferrivorans]QQD72744.1 transcriptional regulator [Acidithiobacillus ferrivorans]